MSDYRYLLSFGSNLGDRHLNCERGIEHLQKKAQFITYSRRIITPPLQSCQFKTDDQSDYLNFIAEIHTDLLPEELYREIVHIEDVVGHDRIKKWQSRHLDIDILYWTVNDGLGLSESSGLTYDAPELIIPHRGLADRDFLGQLLFESHGIRVEELLH